MSQHDHGVSSTAYIESVQHHLKLRTGSHGEIHRSLEFAVDSDGFVRDPLNIIAHVFYHSSCGSVDATHTGEAECDGGEVWRGGGPEG